MFDKIFQRAKSGSSRVALENPISLLNLPTAMSRLKPPRRKRRVYQQLDAPFPVPIQSITDKPASSSQWFYYTGVLKENCVLVQQQGDVIFLYKMGFFGKGMLSKSKPEHSIYLNSYQGLRKKNLPPKERRFQQQRFQQVRKNRYERHLSWSKQFVRQARNLTKDVVSRTDDVSSGTDDVTLRTKDVTSRTEVVTSRTEDVTSRTKDVISRTEGVSSRTEGVTSRTEDVTSRTDEIISVTDDVTTRINDITTRTDNAVTGTDDVTMITDDVTTTSDAMEACEFPERLSKSAINFDSTNSANKTLEKTDSDQGFKSDAAEGVGPKEETEGQSLIRKEDLYEIKEYLQLKLEEAFFLSYGLGCLTVLDENKKALDLTEMWLAFCQRQTNFVASYVAYHYYRSKGWVPRDGLKYGAHYVLYKHGPPFYHGSYSVLVQMVSEGSCDSSDASPSLTWPAVSAVDRITETVAKEVLLCYVIRPSGLSDEDLQSPRCVPRFRVQEIVMKRWVSSRERDAKDQLPPLIS